jgi:hypothetical protein
MATVTAERELTTIDIVKETVIEAPVDIVFQSMLEEMGPGSQLPDGSPFPMKIEPWPGGRWFRDLGNNTGHLWGHVQVIKPPPHAQPLLEVSGPMFMSYPGVNFVQYRLIPEGKNTRLRLTHQAFGHIPQEQRDGMHQGWEHGLKRIREVAERRKGGVR